MRERYFGGEMDRVVQSTSRRPAFLVRLWNPNRCTIGDVVLGRAQSPAYNITNWVRSCALQENSVWEGADDAVASNGTLVLIRDTNARPIPIDETTLLDGAPIRVWVGDERVPADKWILVFTGVVRGTPSFTASTRDAAKVQEMTVMLVGREEAFINSVITGRSYPRGSDVGKCAAETAIEFMGLDAHEVRIGAQRYQVGHDQAQLVDLEVLKGLFQMLQTVGKKPRFDADGFLVAADTDLDKAPARVLSDAVVQEVRDLQRGGSLFNAVRLLGLSNVMTEVVESRKRLAHGEITAGWFVDGVTQRVCFSENAGQDQGGRRAQATELKADVSAFGAFMDAGVQWTPKIEADGHTVFEGTIHFDTGYAPWVAGVLTGVYLVYKALASALRASTLTYGAAQGAEVAEMVATATLVGLILAMQSMGRCAWEIWGEPVEVVFKQLCANTSLEGVPTADLKEAGEIRNDWWYQQAVLDDMAERALKRELVKGCAHEIDMLDDPLLEPDDVIELADASRYYVTSVRRTLERADAPKITTTLTAWRTR